ncbi:hypothetical protein GEMRC1_013397 [Eukaryota sp. GEM-RC1]
MISSLFAAKFNFVQVHEGLLQYLMFLHMFLWVSLSLAAASSNPGYEIVRHYVRSEVNPFFKQFKLFMKLERGPSRDFLVIEYAPTTQLKVSL